MGQGISLHIGVNSVNPDDYGGWSGPLSACESDANDMQKLAARQGFDTKVLLTASATRAAIISSIRDAAKRLEAGDFFLLTYSGHGGQVHDANADEPDALDETWCLYDCQLIDDELRNLWPEFRTGVRVLVLSDSCHSGTVTKAPPDADPAVTDVLGRLQYLYDTRPHLFRCMPEAITYKAYKAKESYYDRVQRELPAEPADIAATVRLISGCQDNQLSMEGDKNGAFTAELLDVWRNGRFNGNYSAFHAAIVSRLPPTQSPNHLIMGKQNPVFDAEKPFTL